MNLLTEFLLALTVAFFLFNVAQTWLAYPTLPERVPTGLNFDGTARGFAPRPVIWFVVIIQAVVLGGIAFSDYAIATHQPGTHGTLLGSSIASTAIMALIWRVQRLLISAARSDSKAVPMGGFWASVIVVISIVLIAAFAIG
jgi:hypothetical protein